MSALERFRIPHMADDDDDLANGEVTTREPATRREITLRQWVKENGPILGSRHKEGRFGRYIERVAKHLDKLHKMGISLGPDFLNSEALLVTVREDGELEPAFSAATVLELT